MERITGNFMMAYFEGVSVSAGPICLNKMIPYFPVPGR